MNYFRWYRKSHWRKGMGQSEVERIAYIPLLEGQDRFKSTANKLFRSNDSTYLRLYDLTSLRHTLRSETNFVK